MITPSRSDSVPVLASASVAKLPVAVDTQGRVRTSKEQRRVILAEFERSGMSAAEFARRMGLKYSTFAFWVQRYRRTKRPARKAPVHLLEAVLTSTPATVLTVLLLGGARLEVREAGQSSAGGGVGSRACQAMLNFSGSLKVCVAIEPWDMRKGFNGLCAAVTERLGEDPKGGALFVFCNRRRTRIKILCWDGTGLWVLTTRLEQGTFSWPRHNEPQTTKLALSPQAQALLTDGVDLRGAKLRPWYQREG